MSNPHLYRTLWRWHFYAGVFCIPFIIFLSVSGAIYLFKPQIESWQDRAENNLTLSGQTASANQHIQAALSALPGALFTSYQLPQSANHAIVITLKKDATKYAVYVHPSNLSILKVVNKDSSFINLVRTFHGELLAGNVGSILVELAACWAIVLVLTGLYLWWPRNLKGFGGIVYPRINLGVRTTLRDLHAVTGFWIAFFTLFLLLSGLPWALVWGGAFKEVRQWANQPKVAAHAHGEHAAHASNQPESNQPDWTLSRQQEKPVWMAQAVANANLPQAVLAAAHAQQLAPPVELSLANSETNNWKAASQNQNRPLRTTVWLDGATGAITKQSTFSEKNTLDKAIGIGIAAHEGQLFGWFNQLLGLITALGLVTLSITGFLMWRKRKPNESLKQALGAPPPPSKRAMGTGVAVITLATAAFLPLLAISIIALIILEQGVLRFLPRTRVWLGI